MQLKQLQEKTTTEKKQLKEEGKKGIESQVSAEKYGVGNSHIQNFIKDQMQILADFENNDPLERKRKLPKPGNEEINKLARQSFKDMSSRKVPISRPLLQDSSLRFAKGGENEDFKTSKSLLQLFRKRQILTFATRSKERGNVPEVATKVWKENLARLCEGYRPEDLYNMD